MIDADQRDWAAGDSNLALRLHLPMAIEVTGEESAPQLRRLSSASLLAGHLKTCGDDHLRLMTDAVSCGCARRQVE